MLQLVQNLRNGKMELLECPIPAADYGTVVIQNIFSAISAGTETSKVTTARANIISKAQQKPEQVRQVIESVKTEGIFPTMQKVKNKLNSPTPLGYSCVGKVISIGAGVTEFKIGDIVSCGGDGANHAEFIKSGKNLCVRVPSNVKYEDAAFTTIGSIALQGIRQATLNLGEWCAVIGLGLIGQLTVQILRASGIRVVGIDIDPYTINEAKKNGAKYSFLRNENNINKKILSLTDGVGVDAVIITAASTSNDPVNFSGMISRKKGRVIIVGAVPTGFSREEYYKKELDLRMSCSYGPGRYDPSYEEKGEDYPVEYVRWTENRNMQAFLSLVEDGKIDPSALITHRFKFLDAFNAYTSILEKSEPYLGILFEYDYKKAAVGTKFYSKKPSTYETESVKIGFIGVGSFAQKFLLPNISKKASFIGVYDRIPYNASHILNKYRFHFATGDYQEITQDADVNTVFIATRHNDHANQVLSALQHNKNIFVEKPLCLSPDELEIINSYYQKNNTRLMVGFNRRFSPLIDKIMNSLSIDVPVAINYRINAGYIHPDSWIQNKEIGGGRIIGEVCHFIDLCCFLAKSKISRLFASSIPDPYHHSDTLAINLCFENGSIANISYFANGSKKLKKEYLEIFSPGFTSIINDFSSMIIYGNRIKKYKTNGQDKGHGYEVAAFIDSIAEGKEAPIPFNEIYHSTYATFKVLESLKLQSQVII